MLEINFTTEFKMNDNFVLHQISELEKYWLFNLHSGDIYILNEVSMFILQILREKTTFNIMVAKMLEHYEVDRTVLCQDVQEILDQLLSDGIILRIEEV